MKPFFLVYLRKWKIGPIPLTLSILTPLHRLYRPKKVKNDRRKLLSNFHAMPYIKMVGLSTPLNGLKTDRGYFLVLILSENTRNVLRQTTEVYSCIIILKIRCLMM